MPQMPVGRVLEIFSVHRPESILLPSARFDDRRDAALHSLMERRPKFNEPGEDRVGRAIFAVERTVATGLAGIGLCSLRSPCFRLLPETHNRSVSGSNPGGAIFVFGGFVGRSGRRLSLGGATCGAGILIEDVDGRARALGIDTPNRLDLPFRVVRGPVPVFIPAIEGIYELLS